MAEQLTPKKAKKILQDGKVQGHQLTDKQKRFFGAISSGEKPKRVAVRRKK